MHDDLGAGTNFESADESPSLPRTLQSPRPSMDEARSRSFLWVSLLLVWAQACGDSTQNTPAPEPPCTPGTTRACSGGDLSVCRQGLYGGDPRWTPCGPAPVLRENYNRCPLGTICQTGSDCAQILIIEQSYASAVCSPRCLVDSDCPPAKSGDPGLQPSCVLNTAENRRMCFLQCVADSVCPAGLTCLGASPEHPGFCTPISCSVGECSAPQVCQEVDSASSPYGICGDP